MLRLHSLFVLSWLGLAGVLSGCEGSYDLEDPSFDVWCGGDLCKWQTDQGRIERVGTWNRDDYGVSFVATPTQISQRQEKAPIHCMLIETVADVAASARVRVKIDYGDDGLIEFDQLVAEARWAKLRFEVPPPEEPGLPVRYILRKEGRGRAVLAHVRVSSSPNCAEARARPDGASCTASSTCLSGRCSDGHCVRCPAGRCGEGITCENDGECASGQCLAGRCRSCGLMGTCPAFSACTADGHCASGLCQGATAPSRLDGTVGLLLAGLSMQCAECREDAECASGHCYRGACASCRSDADCSEEQRCRYSNEFDATERACSPALSAPRARGGLCEGDEDCAGGLACGATGDEPMRCGRACSIAARDCDSPDQACAPSSLVDRLRLDLDWNDVQTRISTCYTRESLGFPDDPFGLQR
jgi:hypothetical protein